MPNETDTDAAAKVAREILELEKKATQGPWRSNHYAFYNANNERIGRCNELEYVEHVCAMRNNIVTLACAVLVLREALDDACKRVLPSMATGFELSLPEIDSTEHYQKVWPEHVKAHMLLFATRRVFGEGK